jgi:hypothetical protein
MRLRITRSQADRKGMLGGHKGVSFTLGTRVEFTQEEQNLLEHYKMWSYQLFTRGQLPITVRDLAQGDTQTVDNVEVLLRNEDVVKQALDQLPPLLDVLRSFGGDEIVEYPRASVTA